MNREEASARLQKIVLELTRLETQVSPLLIKMGHLRREAASIEAAVNREDESDRREVQET